MADELTHDELAYLKGAGQDSDAATTGLDDTPELTDAELRYFQTGGDVSGDLLREYGSPSAPRPKPTYEHHEAHGVVNRTTYDTGLQDERIAHARTQARLELLSDALDALAPPPEPAREPEQQRPDLETDIFGYTGDIGQRLGRLEQQIETGQREMTEERAYKTSLDTAVRRDRSVVDAYTHLLASRAAELMANRYPGESPDQIREAVRQGRVPDDIRQAVVGEERDLYRSAFAAGRDPAADIVRLAGLRGWQSPQQIATVRAAEAEAQRQRREAEAAARQREQDQIDERLRRIVLRIQYGGDVSRADRQFYLQNARNPNLAQMAVR